jgi:hypothetical protein
MVGLMVWHDEPDRSTPVDAAHLNLYSADLAASAAAADASATAAAASAALAVAPTDAAMAAAVGNPASATRTGLNAAYARVAPVPTGVAATDTPALLAALAAMTAGDRLTFRGGTYSINAPLTPPAGVTLLASRGCTISQVTQYTPVFDLFNVDNVTIDDGFTLVNASGPPPGQGTAFRGDAGYCYSAGVWFNGSGNTIGNLRIKDFAMGVYANWNTVANGVGNRIGDLEISGCNHGVLYLCQTGLRIGNIYVHDHVDSSAGANPTHAIYGTGTTTASSTDITVGDCLDVNNPAGQGFQFKYVHGLVLGNLSAHNTFGLLNIEDSFDITGNNLTSVADIGTGVSLMFQTVTTQSARVNFNTVTITRAVDANNPTVALQCDDGYISALVINAVRNGTNTGIAEVELRGLRITLDGVKLRNTGSSSCRAILIGAASYASGDATVRNMEIDGYRNLVDIHSSASGVNVIDYAPAAQRRIGLLTSSYVAPLSGTPTFRVVRRENVNTYSAPNSGVTYYPLAGLETISRFAIPNATAFTIGNPAIGAYAGLTHEIALFNNTAGALGAITWNALYVFISGSPPAAPAAGVTKNIRFMYDGTNWREMG